MKKNYSLSTVILTILFVIVFFPVAVILELAKKYQ